MESTGTAEQITYHPITGKRGVVRDGVFYAVDEESHQNGGTIDPGASQDVTAQPRPQTIAEHLDQTGQPRVVVDAAGRFVNVNAPSIEDPADELGDEFWDDRTFITREVAVQAAQERAQGSWFTLPHTTPKGMRLQKARVRTLELMEKNALGFLPSTLQGKLSKIMNLIDGNVDKVVSDTEAFKRLTSNIDDGNDLADAFCLYGFLEPRLVATEAEETSSVDPGVLWIKRINVNDRIAYFNSCIVDDGKDAGRVLDPFSRKSVSVAPGQQSNKAAAAAKYVPRIR